MEFELRHSDGNPRNSEGALAELSDGSILCAYTKYRGCEGMDHSPADIAGVISRDGGNTWHDAGILVKNKQQNVMSVSLLRLQDGRLAMVYLEKTMVPGGFCDCRPWIVFSDDDAKTWSERISVAGNIPPLYIVVNNDRLVQLKSGRLILPASIYRAAIGGDVHPQGIGVFYLSDDGGKTWRESAQCVYPPQDLRSGLAELGVIERSDGTLFAWARTSGGFQYSMISRDGGERWTNAVADTNFPSPESPMSVKRNPADGFLYAVWNDKSSAFPVNAQSESWGRTPLVLARSRDEGKTWQERVLLESEPDHGYCYIAMMFRGGELFLEYCCGGGKDSFVLQDSKIRSVNIKAAFQ